MKGWLTLIAAFVLTHGAVAQENLRNTLFEAADAALAAAQAADAALLAPRAFERGAIAYVGAEDDLERGRTLERIQNRLSAAVTAFNEATEAAEIARITLAPLIKTRDDALNAMADNFSGSLWDDAEAEFDAASRRLEAADLIGARNRAETAEALYRDAELTAIKAQYLSQTRALLAQARQARVPRDAPLTFARAEALLAQAEQELNENRYDTDLPRSLTQQANYEARHAIYLAGRIRAIREAGGSEENIILMYEEPIREIAAAADLVAQLDEGTDPVASELVAYIEDMRQRELQLQVDLEESRTRIVNLEEEIRELDEQLGGVSRERMALVQRLQAEEQMREQFSRVETMFARDDVRVSREGNSIILRLVGLTFGSGESAIDPRARCAAAAGWRCGGRVPPLPGRRGRPHRLLRRRRVEHGAVTFPGGGGGRVSERRAGRPRVPGQCCGLRRDAPDRQQRDRTGPRAQPPHRRAHRAAAGVVQSASQPATDSATARFSR